MTCSRSSIGSVMVWNRWFVVPKIGIETKPCRIRFRLQSGTMNVSSGSKPYTHAHFWRHMHARIEPKHIFFLISWLIVWFVEHRGIATNIGVFLFMLLMWFGRLLVTLSYLLQQRSSSWCIGWVVTLRFLSCQSRISNLDLWDLGEFLGDLQELLG